MAYICNDCGTLYYDYVPDDTCECGGHDFRHVDDNYICCGQPMKQCGWKPWHMECMECGRLVKVEREYERKE